MISLHVRIYMDETYYSKRISYNNDGNELCDFFNYKLYIYLKNFPTVLCLFELFFKPFKWTWTVCVDGNVCSVLVVLSNVACFLNGLPFLALPNPFNFVLFILLSIKLYRFWVWLGIPLIICLAFAYRRSNLVSFEVFWFSIKRFRESWFTFWYPFCANWCLDSESELR